MDHQPHPRNAEQEPRDTRGGFDPKPQLQLRVLPHPLGVRAAQPAGRGESTGFWELWAAVVVLLEELIPGC